MCVCVLRQIMAVEGVIYVLQSRLKLRRQEGSINAGGCNFNSFLRRTVRFVGMSPPPPPPPETLASLSTPKPTHTKSRPNPRPPHPPGAPTDYPSYPRILLPFKLRPSGVHVFGLCATALVTDIIQLSTGYHAPFFLTVCKPNYTQAGVSCDLNPYITKDICSGQDQHAIVAAR